MKNPAGGNRRGIALGVVGGVAGFSRRGAWWAYLSFDSQVRVTLASIIGELSTAKFVDSLHAMFFHDRATISGKARITPEGYFVADALVARANNIQDYRASELGITDRDANAVVRVFRPESEVFHADSIKSASRLPITLDHPPVLVDASNWREFAKGETGEEIMRDGEFMRVPIRVNDAGAVGSIQTDRQEFSMGYEARIDLTPGVHDGQAYDARLADIRYNHLAACKLARGGPELRITDERQIAQGVEPVTTKVIDGLPVNLADPATAVAVVDRLVAARDAANTDCGAHLATIATRDADISTKDAEITRLTDELGKAKLTPAQLRDAATSHARILADAKRLGVAITDDMDADTARKAAVTAKIGDKAAAYNDDQVAVAFDALVAGLPAEGQPGGPVPVVDATLNGVLGDQTGVVVDGNKAFADARQKRFDRYENAHRGTAKEA